jgi:hypothetical protein
MGCCSGCLGNGDIYFLNLYYCANKKVVILINQKEIILGFQSKNYIDHIYIYI